MQSVDLEDILTDSGIQRQEEMVVQNQTSLQETTIKEETEGLGIEYTNYSPDYSLYQRDYVATTGESEPVETGRSRYRIHRWCFGDQSDFGQPCFMRWRGRGPPGGLKDISPFMSSSTELKFAKGAFLSFALCEKCILGFRQSVRI